MLKKITIPNYVPTLVKGVFEDIEVTYEGGVGNCTIDEVFCNGANITSMLSDVSLAEITSDLSRQLALNCY